MDTEYVLHFIDMRWGTCAYRELDFSITSNGMALFVGTLGF